MRSSRRAQALCVPTATQPALCAPTGSAVFPRGRWAGASLSDRSHSTVETVNLRASAVPVASRLASAKSTLTFNLI